MKNTIIAITATIALLASCSKQECKAPVQGQISTLNVSVCGSTPLRSAVIDEAKINSLQVFVFNGNQLDVYGSAAGSSLTLKATTGVREVWALVNAPDLSSIVSKDELKQTVSTLADNGLDKFVMAGSRPDTLTQSSDVTVQVNRLAARINIQKITRKFSSAGLASLPADKFELRRIYAADVVTNNNYALTLNSGFVWKNSTLSGGSIDSSDQLLLRTPSAPVQIAQGASHEEDLSVYVYPNPTATQSGDALFTRLVAEFRIDENIYTYPIEIENVERNRSYEIKELVITRLGNPSDGDNMIDQGENEKIESFDLPFGIEVKPWLLVLLGDEGTVTI